VSSPSLPASPSGPPALPPFPVAVRTLADLQSMLFDIPLDRILVTPAPGTATVVDCIDSKDRWGTICELFDGVLVAKPMGYLEARIAFLLSVMLGKYLERYDRGIAAGPDGSLRLPGDKVRAPNLAFIGYERLGDRSRLQQPIPEIAPDFVVEVLSPSNRPGEMRQKLADYFAAGVRLVWYIDLASQTATSYDGVDQYEQLGLDGVLTGKDVLPGFEVALGPLLSKAGS
jgi:Uma2 family endonuclease